ncbi:hypothetical protein EMPS_04248 [Entomortierella parvispora]|uniref:Uncharacterized protein n=1 Tax=Entomortierella parvispora TaxID=205924 RepID=A0A9P3LV76_9FUNG|nr:hypothetical protein EMPS_04248 [Entomortierella parvispora]
MGVIQAKLGYPHNLHFLEAITYYIHSQCPELYPQPPEDLRCRAEYRVRQLWCEAKGIIKDLMPHLQWTSYVSMCHVGMLLRTFSASTPFQIDDTQIHQGVLGLLGTSTYNIGSYLSKLPGPPRSAPPSVLDHDSALLRSVNLLDHIDRNGLLKVANSASVDITLPFWSGVGPENLFTPSSTVASTSSPKAGRVAPKEETCPLVMPQTLSSLQIRHPTQIESLNELWRSLIVAQNRQQLCPSIGEGSHHLESCASVVLARNQTDLATSTGPSTSLEAVTTTEPRSRSSTWPPLFRHRTALAPPKVLPIPLTMTQQGSDPRLAANAPPRISASPLPSPISSRDVTPDKPAQCACAFTSVCSILSQQARPYSVDSSPFANVLSAPLDSKQSKHQTTAMAPLSFSPIAVIDSSSGTFTHSSVTRPSKAPPNIPVSILKKTSPAPLPQPETNAVSHHLLHCSASEWSNLTQRHSDLAPDQTPSEQDNPRQMRTQSPIAGTKRSGCWNETPRETKEAIASDVGFFDHGPESEKRDRVSPDRWGSSDHSIEPPGQSWSYSSSPTEQEEGEISPTASPYPSPPPPPSSVNNKPWWPYWPHRQPYYHNTRPNTFKPSRGGGRGYWNKTHYKKNYCSRP